MLARYSLYIHHDYNADFWDFLCHRQIAVDVFAVYGRHSQKSALCSIDKVHSLASWLSRNSLRPPTPMLDRRRPSCRLRWLFSKIRAAVIWYGKKKLSCKSTLENVFVGNDWNGRRGWRWGAGTSENDGNNVGGDVTAVRSPSTYLLCAVGCTQHLLESKFSQVSWEKRVSGT